MVCWIVLLIAAIASFIIRKVFHKKDAHSFWLNIMLLGGVIFGVIDHIWNGELFLISANWAMDLTLGGVITGGIFASWGVIIFKPKIIGSIRHFNYRLGIFKKMKSLL